MIILGASFEFALVISVDNKPKYQYLIKSLILQNSELVMKSVWHKSGQAAFT